MSSIDLNKLLSEVSFKFSRSRGRGGQNVNKVETKVELIFNIDNSNILSEDYKELLKKRLSNKIDKEGSIRVVSQKERTQLANRRIAIEKFTKLIEKALRKKRPRIKTTATFESKLKRLEVKKRQSEKKQQRLKVRF